MGTCDSLFLSMRRKIKSKVLVKGVFAQISCTIMYISIVKNRKLNYHKEIYKFN